MGSRSGEEENLKITKGKRFSGGTHIPDRKELTADIPIEIMPSPDIVVISLSQHIGKPSVPVVNAGDMVSVGQLIAAEGGFVGANVYSSVSGKVAAIEERYNPNGTKSNYIVIENDKNDWSAQPLPEMEDKTAGSILQRIRLAGIVGMGGAGFPAAVKLMPKQAVDCLIINGAECEPYLTCDYRLMKEKTDEIHTGIMLLAKALKVNKVYIGIERNKPDCIKAFSEYDDITVVDLKKRYPMGSEKHLIYSCTGRKVGLGKLPADAGAVVQNVATAYAVYEAVELNKPLYERVMTVSGKGIIHPKNLLVRNGTPLDMIITYCGGMRDDSAMMIAGGPMMGPTMLSSNLYTTKTTSGLLVTTSDEVDMSGPTPCINCGRCAEACPMRLQPMLIDFYAQANDFEKAAKYGGVKNCINCGTCAYVCPAKRSIVQSITLSKKKLAEGGK